MVMQVASLDILTTRGGFEPEVARAIGEAMDLEISKAIVPLATDQQAIAVRHDWKSELSVTRADLLIAVNAVDHKLTATIAAVDQRLTKAIAALEVKIEQTKSEMVRWVFMVALGQFAATLGAMAGMLRFYLPH